MMPSSFQTTGLCQTADRVGIALTAHLFSGNLLSVALAALVGLAAGDGIGAALAGKDSLAYDAASLAAYAFSFCLSIGILSKGREWRYGRPDISAALLTPPIFFAAFFVANIVNALALYFFEGIGVRGPDPGLVLPGGGLRLAFFLLQYVVLPALLEELLFRGVLLENLRVFGDGFAMTASAALFALFHFSLPSFFGFFLLGLLFSYMTVRSRSLFPATVMHLLNNGIAVAFYYLQQHGAEQAAAGFNAMLMTLSILSASGLLLGAISSQLRKIVSARTRTASPVSPREPGRIRFFFTSPWIIAFLAVAAAVMAYVTVQWSSGGTP